MRSTVLILLYCLFSQCLSAQWCADVLDGYEMRYVSQADDYSGKVRSTVIRRCSTRESRIGILYVHGYNDYFFQKEMGDKFADKGYGFYAVDLRKYGRSLMPGQKRFQVRDIREYYADIDSAIAVMKDDGIKSVVMMGHSTGGLISSLYMSEKPDKSVKGLILNSPFLDWNLSGTLEYAIPVVSFIGKIFPEMEIPQGSSPAYAESLLSRFHGEWEYNTDWKLILSPDVEAGWIRVIDTAQEKLQAGNANIGVPILLMYSDKSIDGDEWNAGFNRADAVLDVNEIAKYGRTLGKNIKCLRVKGGLHDLMLSYPALRNRLYVKIFEWLDNSGLNP